MMFKMNKAVTVDESTFQSRAIPTTDADAIRADLLVYNQRPKEAQAFIEGLKAKVQYAEVSDKSVAGQIISVELSK
jgi:hypothetical protein